jgi:hypothetical protein
MGFSLLPYFFMLGHLCEKFKIVKKAANPNFKKIWQLKNETSKKKVSFTVITVRFYFKFYFVSNPALFA